METPGYRTIGSTAWIIIAPDACKKIGRCSTKRIADTSVIEGTREWRSVRDRSAHEFLPSTMVDHCCLFPTTHARSLRCGRRYTISTSDVETRPVIPLAFLRTRCDRPV